MTNKNLLYKKINKNKIKIMKGQYIDLKFSFFKYLFYFIYLFGCNGS